MIRFPLVNSSMAAKKPSMDPTDFHSPKTFDSVIISVMKIP